jgi:hypothetical protein
VASVPLSFPSLPGWEALLSADPENALWGGLVLHLRNARGAHLLAWSPDWGWRPLSAARDASFPTASLGGALAALERAVSAAAWDALFPPGFPAALERGLPCLDGLADAVLVMGS